MFIYLIETPYEGADSRAFSTAALAEQALLAEGDFYSYIVRVTLDSNESVDVEFSPEFLAAKEAAYAEEQADREEFLQTYACDVCGAGYNACECWASIACGELGGITKKGTACLNSVLKRKEQRCYLHR